MKRTYWILLFVIVALGELLGIQLKSDILQLVCKPLIVPILMGYVAASAGMRKTVLILLALFFSFAGDVLLMFQEKQSLFFLLGLSAFLLAHVFYIIFFNRIRVSEKIPVKPLFLFLAVLYYAALIGWLFAYLGPMKISVCVYGIIISLMFVMAMHMLFIKNASAGKLMLAGASLFVASDSVLAVNKFYQPFGTAGMIIMLTYILAQFFIVTGVIQYFSSKE